MSVVPDGTWESAFIRTTICESFATGANVPSRKLALAHFLTFSLSPLRPDRRHALSLWLRLRSAVPSVVEKYLVRRVEGWFALADFALREAAWPPPRSHACPPPPLLHLHKQMKSTAPTVRTLYPAQRFPQPGVNLKPAPRESPGTEIQPRAQNPAVEQPGHGDTEAEKQRELYIPPKRKTSRGTCWRPRSEENFRLMARPSHAPRSRRAVAPSQRWF